MESLYKNLLVWQKSISLVSDIYRFTKDYPKSELYALTSQTRRSAVSIPSNVSEGSQRGTRRDFAHFIDIAKGSTAELETQLIIARNLDYLQDSETFENAISKLLEVRRMLSGLKKSLQS